MKRFVGQFLFFVLLFLMGTALYNYKFDTTGLFNTDFSVERMEPNQHFVKIRYLLDKPKKYNAYCFGSSRVGNIDLKKIDNGYRWYNMTYAGGLPGEWLADLKIMLKHHVEIRQVMVGIDDFSFRWDPIEHESNYTRKSYHDEGNFMTYLVALLKQPAKPYDPKDKGSIYDIYDSGRPLHDRVDKEIEANVEEHVNNPKFLDNTRVLGNRMEKTIDELQELKELCDNNDIELIFFFNPVQKTTYLDNDIEELNEFKFRLVDVMNYYDFSGLNEITTNNYYFYEPSHFRPIMGDMMIKRIFHPEEGTEFGVYVTKENVEEHLKEMKRQVEDAKQGNIDG